MLKHNESKGNFKGLTAAQVSAAIRYLDSGPRDERRWDGNNAVPVIYVIWMFLLNSLALTYRYYEVS
jgi:hypothetical protein